MAEIINSDTHVAVLTFPMSSHPSTVFAMVSRLATYAPNTLFSFFSTSQANKSLISSSHNIKTYDVWDGAPEGHVFSASPLEKIKMFFDAAPQSFKTAMEAATTERGRPVTCLITDAFLWFGGEIAEEMGVPWVAAWIAGGMTLYSHIHTDDIREAVTGSSQEKLNEKITFIPGMSEIRIPDLPHEVLPGDSPVHRLLHRMGQTLPVKADAVLINSIEELEPDMANHLKTKLKCPLMGPFGDLSTQQLSVPDTYGCLSWLDKKKPASVVYIAFGSMLIPPPDELVALREALETSGVPFLWSTSNKDNLKTLLPSSNEKNIMVVPWVPQKKVLSHEAVGVHIMHGGWNSVLESVAGGVPMICRPFFADNHLNSRRVEAVWKIGTTLETLTKEEVMRKLDLILKQEDGKEMRGKLEAMKQAVKTAIEPQGSSSQNLKTILNLVTSKDGINNQIIIN